MASVTCERELPLIDGLGEVGTTRFSLLKRQVVNRLVEELFPSPTAWMDCDESVGKHESNFVHRCHHRHLAMGISGGNRIGVAIEANQ